MPMKAEVLSISKDLEEVYTEIGASALYINKYTNNINNIDDVYGECINPKESYIPYSVIGRVSFSNEKERLLDVGNKLNTFSYNIKILKSSIEKHKITPPTPKDQIIYNDVILEISSVKPSIVLGDYFVQYDIEAYGKEPILDVE